MNFPFHSFDPVYKAQAALEILNLNFRLSVGPFQCRRAGDLLWSVASLEYNFIVAPRHIEQEELEAVLVHVLGLVFVLAQPGKSEFTDRSPNALTEEKHLQARLGRTSLYTKHRYGQPCGTCRTRTSSLAGLSGQQLLNPAHGQYKT